MIILCGASASGKTEVVKCLVKNYGYKKLVTYTTREKRNGEINGVDYNFISRQEFIDLKQNNFFFETVEYNNNFYGTAIKDITNEKVVILEPSGFQKYHHSDLPCVIGFFLDSKLDNRVKRMIERGDSLESIEFRKKNDDILFSKESIEGMDYIINSDGLSIDEIALQVNDIYSRCTK